MFDKLIESDTKGAEFKGRSRYFLVSTVVVGILFVTAVVFSLYAADIGLGNEEFELSMMLAPVTPEAPEPPKPLQEQNQPQTRRSDVPIRNQNMLRLDENPDKVPTAISVTPNASLSRPNERFNIGSGIETIGNGPQSNGGTPGGVPEGTGSGYANEPKASPEKIPDPPPVFKPKPEAPKPPVSIGVVNGRATSLPKPPYPPAALAMHAEGEVGVQVTIDEQGKVVSSKAVSGHPLLKGAAEKAAWSARFTPTLLSKVPVKVTGMIIYRFSRN